MRPGHSSRAIIIATLMAWYGSAFGQLSPTLSKRAAAAKLAVERLHTHDKLSVIPVTGQEEFGTLLVNDNEGFTLYDVDTKAPVSFHYADVKRVKPGYGGYNFVVRRHTDRTNSTLTLLVIAAGLVGLVAAAAAAD